jgi:hypothetical protein
LASIVTKHSSFVSLRQNTDQIIRQIALTGCRRSEMIGLTRTEDADREIDDFMTVPRSRPG